MNSSDRPAANSAGDRGGDRRQKDRRKVDRRAPLPLWRRPWAYVAYGVTGALLVIVLLSLGDEEPQEPATATPVGTRVALPAVDSSAIGRGTGAIRDAHGTAGFEALLAEGESATGQQVRTMLYCEPIRSIALRRSADVTVHASIAEHAGTAGRVPAAECHWGAELSAPEVLLIVPPALAPRFATMREVEQSFVLRREVPAVVEWVGRSDALALRTVAVLRAIGGESQP